jgi:hypothetical protein
VQREGSELVLGPFCTLGAFLVALGLVGRSRATAARGLAALAAERRLPLARKPTEALTMNRPEA